MSARTFDLFKPKMYGNVKVELVETATGDTVRNVWLYSTLVLQYNETRKTVKLDTGGWNTATTRTAMNTALKQLQRFERMRVYTVKGVMLIGSTGNDWTFHDGIKFKAGLGKVEKVEVLG